MDMLNIYLAFGLPYGFWEKSGIFVELLLCGRDTLMMAAILKCRFRSFLVYFDNI